MFGVLRILSPQADAGEPQPGRVIPDRDLVFPITQSATTIGCGLHNAIVLFAPSVSNEHAVLHYEHGHWWVDNHAPDHLLLVDGEPVPEEHAATVHPGQLLTVGEVQMQLVAPALPASVLTLAEHDQAAHNASMAAAEGRVWRELYARFRARRGLDLLGMLIPAFLVMFAIVNFFLSVHGANSADFILRLTLPLIPAAGVVGIVILFDRYELRPWYLLLSAFLWGALIAIPSAFFIEQSINMAIVALRIGDPTLLSSLNAGLTEEIVKGAGLLVLLGVMRTKFTTVSDGIIYGAIIGAGFGMVENIYFFFYANAHNRTDFAIFVIGRIILGWLGHSTFTAFLGAALGYLRERRLRNGWIILLSGFIGVVALHTIFDYVATVAQNMSAHSPTAALIAVLAILGDYLLLFGAQWILFIILMRALARESAVLREYLVDEVCDGIVTPDEYVLLQQASPRTRLRRELLMILDFDLWRAVRRLQAAEVRLAFANRRKAVATPYSIAAASLLPPATYRARIRQQRRIIAGIEQRVVEHLHAAHVVSRADRKRVIH